MTGYESKKNMAQDKLAQPEQEPVAFFDPQSEGFYWAKPTKVIPPVTVDVEPLPLYTTPPQRPWVYLTDEHIKEIVGPYGDVPIKGYTRKLFDQIEAKSKELNNG